MTNYWDWLKNTWTGKARSLEERIQSQIDLLRVASEEASNEAANATGFGSHLDKRIKRLEARHEHIDANYVRVVATAIDEKLASKFLEMDTRFQAHQAAINDLLRGIEERCFTTMRTLESDIAGLREDIIALNNRLASTLARLRAVGEGN